MAVPFPDVFLHVPLSHILYNRNANNLSEKLNLIPVKDFAYSTCKEFSLFKLDVWIYVNPLPVLSPSPCLKSERKKV